MAAFKLVKMLTHTRTYLYVCMYMLPIRSNEAVLRPLCEDDPQFASWTFHSFATNAILRAEWICSLWSVAAMGAEFEEHKKNISTQPNQSSCMTEDQLTARFVYQMTLPPPPSPLPHTHVID